MISIKNQIPYDYYYLNICPPEDVEKVKDNLGEIITGSKTYYTNYKVKVNQNEYCKQLCKKKISKANYNNFKFLIDKKYNANWYLDMLPAGYATTVDLLTDEPKLEIDYSMGVPLGEKKDNKTYIYHHFRMYVDTHTEDNENYQIVGFKIEPFSIKQSETSLCGSSNNNTSFTPVVSLLDMDKQEVEIDQYVFFTYDVVFRPSNITFASRFDHYSNINSKVHWFGIINSNVLIFVLTFLTIVIFTRSLKKDIEIYNTKVTNEEIIDEYGWKQVCNDVFRKPIHCEILSALVGTGIQIMIMITYTLFFAVLGFFRPEARGSMLTMMIMVFVFLSVVGGYISSRMYKFFHGRNWLRCAINTSLIFPGFCFGLLMLVNWMYRLEGSTVGLGFSQISSVGILWICCSTPLVLVGAFIGIKQRGIETPCKINPVPSQIPEKPWFFHMKYSCWVTGLLPFGAVFIEFIYIMSSIWKHELFFLATFAMIALLVLLITSAEIGFLFVYVNLCRGDYNWWWKCYMASASPVIYVMLYSIYYFFSLEMTRLSTIVIYFGLMSLISFVIALICGGVGVVSSLMILKKIYSMIKVD